MAIRPDINAFQLQINSTVLALLPGTTVTPGNNTYGTYAQVMSGATVTDDSYGIWINITTNSVSASARDTLVKIGLDPAGGTSYLDFILDLAGASAASASGGLGGIWYYFPVRTAAGTSIAAAASVNNATVGTLAVMIRLECQPTHPELIRAGSYVRTFGSTPASSSGTSVTAGSDAKGTYVQLGSAIAAGDNLWYWNMGIGLNQAVATPNSYLFDLAVGDATTKRLLVPDQPASASASEALSYSSIGAPAIAAPGDLLYGRCGARGGTHTGWSMMAYGVGG